MTSHNSPHPTSSPWADPVDFETYGTIYQPRGGAAEAVWGTDTAYPLRGRITPDGEFPAHAGRYHLFVSKACPFAHRALIVRALLGLEEVVSVSVVDPLRDGRGWAFRPFPGSTADTSGEGFRFLSEAYEATVSPYRGRVSVPLLWDKLQHRAVANYYPTITLDLATQLRHLGAHPEVELYPAHLRTQIDALNDRIGPHVNHGVYHAGFARTQEEYEAGYAEVFTALDWLEQLLSDAGPYLLGDQLTEADVRLWVTLARFDSVYHGHFKLNRNRIVDFPALWQYTRRLAQLPAFRDTTDLHQITVHYYGTQLHINPTGIVPVGPQLDWAIAPSAAKEAQ